MKIFQNFGPGQFRIFLAALVVLSHLSSLGIGRPAVFTFFMLSGYWVLRMYEENIAPIRRSNFFIYHASCGYGFLLRQHF